MTTLMVLCNLQVGLAQSPSETFREATMEEVRQLREALKFESGDFARDVRSRRSHEAGGSDSLDRAAGALLAQKQSVSASKEVTVDCLKGQSINEALTTKASELIVNVEGICVENVEITRDRVTLRGSDPALDGIQAAGTYTGSRESALKIRDAQEVAIENLHFTGSSWDGIRILNSYDDITLSNLRLEGNAVRGLTLLDAIASIDNLLVVGNGSGESGGHGGIYAYGSSIAVCEQCEIVGNGGVTSGTAVLASNGAEVAIRNSSIGSIGNGLYADQASKITAFDTVVTASRFGGLAVTQSTIEMVDSQVDSEFTAVFAFDFGTVYLVRVPFNGRLGVEGRSSVFLRGAHQIGSSYNFVSNNSSLVVASDFSETPPIPSSVAGTLAVAQFSNASLFTGTSVDDLQCSLVSDAICPGATVGSSNCGNCLVP